jgi:hypothetical protein
MFQYVLEHGVPEGVSWEQWQTLDIIRNTCGDGTHSNRVYRNVVLTLCQPHAISSTRSSNWALVLRKTS